MDHYFRFKAFLSGTSEPSVCGGILTTPVHLRYQRCDTVIYIQCYDRGCGENRDPGEIQRNDKEGVAGTFARTSQDSHPSE